MTDLISSDLDPDLKNAWRSDPVVYNAMNKEFDFFLDAAASKDNALCSMFLNKHDNAPTCDWSQLVHDHRKAVWINPPYGRGCIKTFMKQATKMKFQGITTVMLVPATLDAQWLPIKFISEIRIVTGGRLSFYHPVTGKKVNKNTKGSMFVIFRPSDMPCFTRLIDRDELLAYGAINDER